MDVFFFYIHCSKFSNLIFVLKERSLQNETTVAFEFHFGFSGRNAGVEKRKKKKQVENEQLPKEIQIKIGTEIFQRKGTCADVYSWLQIEMRAVFFVFILFFRLKQEILLHRRYIILLVFERDGIKMELYRIIFDVINITLKLL